MDRRIASSRAFSSLLLLLAVSVSSAPAAQLYWSDSELGHMRRANVDGSDARDFLPDMGAVTDIAFNPIDQRVYWSTPGPSSRVYSSTADGTDVRELFGRADQSIRRIAVDGKNGKLYVAVDESSQIRRSNLDGSEDEVFVTGYFEVQDIALDADYGLLFWSDIENLSRAPLDGSAWSVSHSDVVGAGIALDPTSQLIYWPLREFIAVDRYNENSNWILHEQGHLTFPMSLALDPIGQKLYWTESTSDALPGPSIIRRINLDGTMPEDVISGVSPTSLVFVPEPSCWLLAVFWLLGLAMADHLQRGAAVGR